MQRGFAYLALLVFTALGLIIATIFFFRKSDSPSPVTINEMASEEKPINIKVLAIGYNPQENGRSIADTYFEEQMGGRASEVFEDWAFGKTKDTFYRLSDGLINFEIVKKIQITDFPEYEDGSRYTLDSYSSCVIGRSNTDFASCEKRKKLFNYEKWLKDYEICQLVQEVGADEVWMLSLPFIMTWENFMFGPSPGFDVNGPSFVVSGCDKHYIVVNGTYERPENIMHNHAHRIESTLRFISGGWKSSDKQKYLENFLATDLYRGRKPNKPFCGNGHFPSNTFVEFEHDSKLIALSNCSDWPNFPNFKGNTESISCEDWGCNDEGWQEYWFSFIPRGSGEIEMTSELGKKFRFKRNWWHYLLFPENAIEVRIPPLGWTR